MPKVSVIIPTYNRAHLIARTIESVLAQSFHDFEIVVIDDGSTDNTEEVLSKFPVKYIKQRNQGPGAARNKGIQLSTGEYIALLDCDDVYYKDALAKGVEVLDSHLGVGFSYGQAYITDEDGNVIAQEPKSSRSCIRQGWEELKYYLLTGYHTTMSTVLIRRSCIEEVGGFKDTFQSGSEDLDLWTRLAKRYDVAYIAEPLAKWGSLSQGFSSKRGVGELEKANSFIIQSICDDSELGQSLRHLRPIAYFLLYSKLAGKACSRGDRKIAREYLFRAAVVHPLSLFGRQGLRWILRFIRTWMPIPVVSFVSRVKRYLANVQRDRFQSNLDYG